MSARGSDSSAFYLVGMSKQYFVVGVCVCLCMPTYNTLEIYENTIILSKNSFFSTKHLSFDFCSAKEGQSIYRIKSHRSTHACNHRRNGVAGPTSSLFFMLSPCHSIPTSVALGLARGIPGVVYAPCATAHLLHT